MVYLTLSKKQTEYAEFHYKSQKELEEILTDLRNICPFSFERERAIIFKDDPDIRKASPNPINETSSVSNLLAKSRNNELFTQRLRRYLKRNAHYLERESSPEVSYYDNHEVPWKNKEFDPIDESRFKNTIIVNKFKPTEEQLNPLLHKKQHNPWQDSCLYHKFELDKNTSIKIDIE